MPHNVEDVIGDIEDVKDDLHDFTKRRAKEEMEFVKFAAVENIETDADWQGRLRRSLEVEQFDWRTGHSTEVRTDPKIAPHAIFVEFGTGSRTLRTAPQAPSRRPRTPDETPADFPFSSPTIRSQEGFEEFAGNIQEWVEGKPIVPEADISQEQLAFSIAATIIEEGTYSHPFLQPAWFDQLRAIKFGMKDSVRAAFS